MSQGSDHILSQTQQQTAMSQTGACDRGSGLAAAQSSRSGSVHPPALSGDVRSDLKVADDGDDLKRQQSE